MEKRPLIQAGNPRIDIWTVSNNPELMHPFAWTIGDILRFDMKGIRLRM